MCCLCNYICKWLDVQVFSDKDYKPQAPSPASSVLWLAGDVKEPTRLSQRVGHEVPGVVVWPLLLKWGLGWEMLGDISYHKATLQSEGKHGIHSSPYPIKPYRSLPMSPCINLPYTRLLTLTLPYSTYPTILYLPQTILSYPFPPYLSPCLSPYCPAL